jgi:hypothetical protein
MVLGFTGTQNGMNSFQESEVLKLFDSTQPETLHHGDCIGSDAQCHYLFLRWHACNDYMKRNIIVHPPIDEKKRAFVLKAQMGQSLIDLMTNCKNSIDIIELQPLSYFDRNYEIVRACNLLIVTPKELEHTVRSGTWKTVRYAWQLKKDVRVIPPLFAAPADNTYNDTDSVLKFNE